MEDKINSNEPETPNNNVAELLKEIEQNPNLGNYMLGLLDYRLGNLSSALNHLKEFLKNDPDSYSGNFLLGEIFIRNGEYLKACDCLKKIVPDINSNEDFEKLESLIEMLIENKQFDIAKDLLSKASTINFELCMGYPLAWEMQNLVESEMYFEVLQARLEERYKIIADLSHSLKNIVATITDPLENLRQTKEYVDLTIENALRGANLVREITNAMNSSLKGSIDDFYYDAKYNQGHEWQSLADMVTTSLRNSVTNMFDAKYFSSFSKQYFPDRDSYYLAKSDWTDIGTVADTKKILAYIEKYLTKIEIDLKEIGSLAIGNTKGSAVKLLTIIQEMILNAVKYSAFVDRSERFVRIKFSGDKKHVTLSVENRFKPRVKVKTTGMGQVILKNFAEMLNTALEIKNVKNIYSVKFEIPNFWEGSKS